MKKILLFLLLLFSASLKAQKVDTIFVNEAYKSHFSYQLQVPLYVEYKLYQGGGPCDRSKFRFKNDVGVSMADNEYAKSGYDRGHLANAEDFAGNCYLDELTFRYYNCLPQTPNMNRGIWKSWETKIRESSQTDSLLIVTGGIWKEGRNRNGMAVPEKCWKIVYSLTTKKPLHVLLFTNEFTDSKCTIVTLEELKKMLPFPLRFSL
jgi:endonuclease G